MWAREIHREKRAQTMQNDWRDLIKPKTVEFDEKEVTPSYGRFSAEPLERGYGITVGNALRRILLSSLPGYAITAVRIKNVLHEFSTLAGVKEDVTDIVLNLKEIRLRLHEGEQITATLKVKGEAAGHRARHHRRPEPRNPDPRQAYRVARQGRRPRYGTRHQARPRLRPRRAHRRRRSRSARSASTRSSRRFAK